MVWKGGSLPRMFVHSDRVYQQYVHNCAGDQGELH